MHSGNAMTPENPSFATTCGIAALVLEGRPLWEDQYEPDADVQSPDLDAILPANPLVASGPSSSSSLSSANNSTAGNGASNTSSPESSAGLPGCSSTPTSSTSGCGGSSSSNSSSGGSRSIPKVWRDETVQHIQRLRNKLMLIRSAPGISRTAVEQAIAVSSGSSQLAEPIDSDDEPDDGFTYDVRSRTFSRLPCTNTNSGGGAPGLLSSLQSLATNSCLSTTPRSMVRVDGQFASSGYAANRLQGTVAVATPPPAVAESVAAAACSTPTPTACAEKTKPKKKIGPHCEEFLKRIGLIKSPSSASDASNSAATTPRSVPRLPSPKVPYVEEHQCNPRTANCKRWIHEYHKLKSIFTTADAICIDVYLGPDHHAILLEQWTIQQCDRTNQMTMTLPSLCSAIRSQLYFSQISAWSEQLKTARRHDPLIRSNPRLLVIGDSVRLDVHYRIRTFDNTASFTSKPNVHNFPDAIVSDTSCIRVSLKSLPRLDAIPTLVVDMPTNVTCHSVQEATLGAAAAVVAAAAAATSVCAGPSTSATAMSMTAASSSATSSNRRPMPKSAANTSSSSSSSSKRVLNDRPMQQQQQQQHRCNETGKHQCAAQYDEERTSDESGGSSSPPPSPLENPLLSHRNRQLQKYRKRLLRRDQKKRPQPLAASQSVTATANITTNTTTTTTTTTVAIVHATTDAADGIDEGHCKPTTTGQMISINSIRPPLYSAMESSSVGAVLTAVAPASLPTTCGPLAREDCATANPPPTTAAYLNCAVEMKSTGTQTNVDCPADMGGDSPVYPNCDLCGIEMQYVCWNCDRKLFERWSSRPASPAQSVVGQLPGTGDCLMQSIQRTPSFRQIQLARQRKITAASVQAPAACAANANICDTQHIVQSSTEECLSRSTAVAGGSGTTGVGRANDNSDCGLCKRQKKDYLDSPSREGALGGDGSMLSINNNNESICSYNAIGSSNNNAAATLNVFPASPSQSDSGLDNVSVDSMLKCGGLDEEMTGLFHRRTMSESLDSTPPESAVAAAANAASARYNAEFMLSTGSTCYSPNLLHRQSNHVISPVSGADLKLYRRAFSEDVLTCTDEDNDAGRSLADLKGVAVERNGQSQHLAGPSRAVFKTPTNLPVRSRMIPHQLTISTTNRDLLPPLPMSCSPSSSMSAMSLDSSPMRQPSPVPAATSTSTGTHQLLLTPARAERPLPIVNLSKIFCATPPQMADVDAGSQFTFDSVFAVAADARPTTIGLVKQRSSYLADTGDDDLLPDCHTVMGTVHKSNSAPSFAAAAAAAASTGTGTSSAHHLLSPRFLKMAAMQKRRSRHLSDRSSERSSIGSDELLSDDELAIGADARCLSMISPNRLARSRLFGRRPLLGSIEESLLQRCFVPTAYVPGFKVLLGASGSFYPTQLTLPTSTSFYELPGQCLSTPYTCEVRMPRKGYAIPRKGIVQVILLNPLGTLVRMFVVPYDLRDMPVLHQTFMRQRVLAFDERLADTPDGGSASACGLTNSEQMKLLRYAIHLRFQTSRSGRLVLHTDIRMVISRRTDCDTAAVYAKRALEAPKDLKVVVLTPDGPKYSPRLD